VSSVVGLAAALGLVSAAGCGSVAPRAETSSSAALAPRAPLVFVEDDFAKAVSIAERTHRPIFVDSWAPWCHTCLSMRATTLTDPSLGALADRFVWLSIDTEKPENAAFVARFPNRAWPTLWVLDEHGKEVRLAWAGSATASELRSLLDDVTAGGDRADFARAAALMASGDVEGAKKAFLAVRADARSSVSTKARAAEALAALCGQNHAECIELAKVTLSELPAGSSRAAVLVTALSAATEAGRDEPWLFAEAEKTARDEAAPYVPDDRSCIYEALVDLHEARHEPAKKKETAEAWASFLDRTAAAAKSDELRFVYDAHRFLAARALDTPARALAMLETSAARFPEDGNAHARLSKAYSLLGQDERALAEGARALTLLRGPRSLRAAELVADVYEKAGNRVEAARALATALDRVKDLPLTSSQRKLAASLARRRASLGAPGSAAAPR
jgi:thioredoxin-like negative regulator of GroEL